MFTRVCAIAATAVSLAGGTVVAGPADAGTVPGKTIANNTPVYWAGNVWLAKNSPVVKQGPAPNYWLAGPTSAYTDSQNRLHLVARQIAGRWFCAAVTSTKSDYGYGTYRFVIDTPLKSFDRMAVVGMFTYNDSVAYSTGHQEIDVELSRWGQPSTAAANSQYVVQPWRKRNHLLRFPAPINAPSLTYEFTWLPSGVTFRLLKGSAPTARLIKTWKTGAPPGEPTAGTHVNLNMWLYQGQAPYDQANHQVVFENFTYTPAG